MTVRCQELKLIYSFIRSRMLYVADMHIGGWTYMVGDEKAWEVVVALPAIPGREDGP